MRYLRLKALLILTVLAVATAAGAAEKVKYVPVRLSRTIDGAELYREHCAVCHGADAKGNGPAAVALKKAPADLTAIAAQNGGKFPDLAVKRKIKGDDIVEHGTEQMPVWGKLFAPEGHQDTDAQLRIYALVRYLDKLQAR